MRRCAERGGLFYDIERGISLGCPLSLLMGALFLQTLNERMEQLGLFYLRPLLLIDSYWPDLLLVLTRSGRPDLPLVLTASG